MVASTLVNHCGARQVNAAELATIEPPTPTRTWYPLAHRSVLDSVCATLEGANFTIVRSRLSVSYGGARFFGTLDLATSISDGVSLCVGVRNSNDRADQGLRWFGQPRREPVRRAKEPPSPASQ